MGGVRIDLDKPKSFGLALQAHALTISKDATRKVLQSVYLETCADGFTMTSTDSHVLLHTFTPCQYTNRDGQPEPAPYESVAFRFWASHNKPREALRDLGKALADELAVRLGFPLTEEREQSGTSTNLARNDLKILSGVDLKPLALPLSTNVGEDFPKYRELFAARDADGEPNRGVVLSSDLLTRLGKFSALAKKAGGGTFVGEPNAREGGPVRFHFPIGDGERWHGLAMPMKFDYSASAHFQIMPAVAPLASTVAHA